jgi:hypothetical protein
MNRDGRAMLLRFLSPRYWYWRWFVTPPIYLDVKDGGSLTMTLSDPAIAERRKRLIAFVQSPWTITIGGGLVLTLVAQLLALI